MKRRGDRKNATPHICYHAEIGRFMSNGVGINIREQKWGTWEWVAWLTC